MFPWPGRYPSRFKIAAVSRSLHTFAAPRATQSLRDPQFGGAGRCHCVGALGPCRYRRRPASLRRCSGGSSLCMIRLDDNIGRISGNSACSADYMCGYQHCKQCEPVYTAKIDENIKRITRNRDRLAPSNTGSPHNNARDPVNRQVAALCTSGCALNWTEDAPDKTGETATRCGTMPFNRRKSLSKVGEMPYKGAGASNACGAMPFRLGGTPDTRGAMPCQARRDA